MLIAFFVNAMADEYQGYTTTLLAHEASRRGHDVCYVTPEDFVFDVDDRMRAHARFVPAARQPRRRTLARFFKDLQSVADRTRLVDMTDIDVLLQENRKFPPPDDFRRRAHVASPEQYDEAGIQLVASSTDSVEDLQKSLAAFRKTEVAAAKQAAPSESVALSAPLPVLVIDDSLTTRMLEQSILESAGYEVEVASSAEEGLEKALRRRYGLFLVDVEMPGMDGFSFVERTRNDPVLRATPAILVTSRDAPEDRARGKQVGASAYVVKSEFDQVELLDRIRSLMR